MKATKKIISIALTFILFFTGLPDHFLNFGGVSKAYAAEGTPAISISYDDFNSTDNLQLNGSSRRQCHTV